MTSDHAPQTLFDNSLNYKAWVELLPKDIEDREYILDGIKNGFRLSTKSGPKICVGRDNYTSAFLEREKIEKQIKQEIEPGNYIVTKQMPTIISSLGAIPKPNGDVRLIHDASQPI